MCIIDQLAYGWAAAHLGLQLSSFNKRQAQIDKIALTLSIAKKK
jgi:hypothetical protein